MSNVILHIGIPKTGTTSIQYFLFSNRGILNTQGIEYPIFSIPLKDKKNGTFFRKYCEAILQKKDPETVIPNVNSNWQILENAINKYHTIILSDEGIYLTPDNSWDSIQLLYDYWRILINTLYSYKVDKITIIIYLRKQEEYVTSLWKHECKTGRNGLPFQEFCAHKRNQCSMDFYRMITAIASTLKETDSIVVRKYNKTSFIGGNIFQDFCFAANIKWDSRYVIPKYRENLSISCDVAEAVRSFSFCGKKGNELRDNIIIPLTYKLSSKFPDTPNTTPLRDDEMMKINESTKEGNTKIAEQFFHEQKLFSDSYYSGTWSPKSKNILIIKANLFLNLLFSKKWYYFIYLMILNIVKNVGSLSTP